MPSPLTITIDWDRRRVHAVADDLMRTAFGFDRHPDGLPDRVRQHYIKLAEVAIESATRNDVRCWDDLVRLSESLASESA